MILRNKTDDFDCSSQILDLDTEYPVKDKELSMFLLEARGIRNNLKQIDENLKEIILLEKYLNINLMLEERKKEFLKEKRKQKIEIIETLNTKIRFKLKNTSKRAKELETKEPTKAKTQIFKSLSASLLTEFLCALKNYSNVSNKMKREHDKIISNSFLLLKPNATPEDLRAVTAIEGSNILNELYSVATKKTALESLKKMKKRHSDISEIGKSLKKLNEIFVDMQLLVNAQSSLINEIEKNVYEIEELQQKSSKVLGKAAEYARDSQSSIWIAIVLFFIILFICFVFVLFVLNSADGHLKNFVRFRNTITSNVKKII